MSQQILQNHSGYLSCITQRQNPETQVGICLGHAQPLTRGAAWASGGWGSAAWSCRSGPCDSGGSRCRSWQTSAWTGACWCPGRGYTTETRAGRAGERKSRWRENLGIQNYRWVCVFHSIHCNSSVLPLARSKSFQSMSKNRAENGSSQRVSNRHSQLTWDSSWCGFMPGSVQPPMTHHQTVGLEWHSPTARWGCGVSGWRRDAGCCKDLHVAVLACDVISAH